MSWVNNDGLELKFGTAKAADKIIGEYHFDGPTHMVELAFDYTDLPVYTASDTLIRDNFTLPVGAYIESVEIQCSTDMDSSGDALTFDLGTIDTDRSSNGDGNSLIDAATQTEMNTGGTNVAGWVGVLIGGAALTTAKLLTWNTDTATATAGKGKIRIQYSLPGSE